jgi:hypothetical protein
MGALYEKFYIIKGFTRGMNANEGAVFKEVLIVKRELYETANGVVEYEFIKGFTRGVNDNIKKGELYEDDCGVFYKAASHSLAQAGVAGHVREDKIYMVGQRVVEVY